MTLGVGAVITAREDPALPEEVRGAAFKRVHGAAQAYNLVNLFKTLALPTDHIFLSPSHRYAFSCHLRPSVGSETSRPSPLGAAVSASPALPRPFREGFLRGTWWRHTETPTAQGQGQLSPTPWTSSS